MANESPPRDPGSGVADSDIAIVGLAGRFPGARDVEELWRNLRAGADCVTRFAPEKLLAAGVAPELLADPDYVPAAAVLDGVDLFDAGFFGYPPEQARLLDPQQRLFLETAWHALEDAGVDPDRAGGLVGVFAGSQLSTYLVHNLLPHPELERTVGTIELALANDKDSLATRVSHALGLTGPSYTVQSYCSTALVAVSAACTSLLTGESDLALAGAACVMVPHRVGYLYQDGGVVSPDGRCRAFDASARGTVFGSGVGAVVLRRLADAVAERDRVYAVIRGWAVNNDGSEKAGFTAPSVRGQAAVLAEALGAAGLDPADIDYLEAHGTGTELGDAVEIASWQQVFADTDRLAVGSVKTNLGHLDRAAGIAGLIKTALALHHSELPATINLTRPNPQLRHSGGRIEVVTELRPWPSGDRPRRAGVSAFGFGGTNAHVVVEEAPAPTRGEHLPPRPRQLLVWSARTPEAAAAAGAELATTLAGCRGDSMELADLAYTLQTGRKVFPHRHAVVVASPADAARALGADAARRVLTGTDARVDREVAFLVTGDHEPEVTGELYETEPVFRAAVDACAAQGLAHDGACAMFAAGYALGTLLMAWGVRPSALTGHGVGSVVAACLTGTLTLPEAAGLVAVRGEYDAGPAVGGGDPVLVEIGPGTAGTAAIRTLPAPSDRCGQSEVLTGAIARLWLAGVHVDWSAYHAGRGARKAGVPRYAFRRERHWIDPPERTEEAGTRGRRDSRTSARSAGCEDRPGSWSRVAAAGGEGRITGLSK